MKTTALRTHLPVRQSSLLSLGAILLVSWGSLLAQAMENTTPEIQGISPVIVQGDHDFLQRMEGVLPTSSTPPAPATSTRTARTTAASSTDAPSTTSRKVATTQINPPPTRSRPVSPIARTEPARTALAARSARPVRTESDFEPISRADLQPSRDVTSTTTYGSRVTTTRDYSLSRPAPIASVDTTYSGGEVVNNFRSDDTITVRRAVPVYRGQVVVEDRPVVVEQDYDDDDSTVRDQPRRRHGIGGFFHRVFGRD